VPNSERASGVGEQGPSYTAAPQSVSRCDWYLLLHESHTLEEFFQKYNSICMYFRRRLEELLLASLEGLEHVQSEWSSYVAECVSATAEIRSTVQPCLIERFSRKQIDDKLLSDLLHAVDNIETREDLAKGFASNLLEIYKYGRLSVAVQVQSDIAGEKESCKDRVAWEQYFWVAHAIAIRTRLAADEIRREIEPVAQGASLHGKSLRNLLDHWVVWLRILSQSSSKSRTDIRLGFTPIHATMESGQRYLGDIVSQLSGKLYLGKSSDLYKQVANSLDDISHCMCLLVDELYERDRFAGVSRRQDPPLQPKILCYKGSSKKFPVVAQCINYDIVESGQSVYEALAKLGRLYHAAVEHVKKYDVADLPPAPVSFQRRFREKKSSSTAFSWGGFEVCCDDVPTLQDQDSQCFR